MLDSVFIDMNGRFLLKDKYIRVSIVLVCELFQKFVYKKCLLILLLSWDYTTAKKANLGSDLLKYSKEVNINRLLKFDNNKRTP